MLSREYLRERADDYRQALTNRGANVDLDTFLELERQRRAAIQDVEQKKAYRNEISKVIAGRKKEGLDTTAEIAAMKKLGDDIKAIDAGLTETEERLQNLELYFPNVPHESVPVGKDESANRVEKTWGDKPSFDFTPKPHWEVGESLGILDFERAAKITGARFVILTGAGAQLSRALASFMLDEHTSNGYTEILTPFMVNADSLRGTSQLPKFEEDLFKLTGEKPYYLIPTAEVPVTNIYRDEFLDASTLTQSFCSYSPCFRSEAGSYGKDTRGMIRLHQFEKVELVKFTMPDRSWDEHENLVRDAESILEKLNLPYRRMTLSTGDMGFASAKTYDLEVWLPGQETFREISSCTNFTDFQARRANIRYRTADKKTGLVHTINGSALPLGRTLVAILENYQQADGSVIIPEPLRRYMKGMERIAR